ncbi:hypothetical protein StoSoilB20_09270 [Arthrobacter sp. StoSoilB20]|nr:hypothetical protein StoSoilB20_09270 [Arthrobacter sp. StoSoilB20]
MNPGTAAVAAGAAATPAPTATPPARSDKDRKAATRAVFMPGFLFLAMGVPTHATPNGLISREVKWRVCAATAVARFADGVIASSLWIMSYDLLCTCPKLWALRR